jgi:hypothetical protein
MICNYKVNIYFMVKIFSAIIIFILSVYISSYFTAGDQLAYNKAYYGIIGLDIFSAYLHYQGSVGSLEPIHFFISWIVSNLGMEKDIFIAFSNSILVYILISVLQSWRVSITVIISIVFFNFYFTVLYFSAERLKFGIILLLLSVLNYKNYKKSIFFTFFAIITHVQTAIIYISILFKKVFLDILNLFHTGKLSKNIVYLSFLFTIPIIILSDHIFYKFSSFTSLFGIQDLIKTFLFFIMSLYYSKDKKETALIFIPLFVMIIFVGDTRINMLSYFIFLYYSLQINRGLNFGILVTSLYFGYKSIDFVSNIFLYGNGFIK